MAIKSFIFNISSFKKVSWNPRYTHNYSKIHEYSDVFMNTNNHECLGSALSSRKQLNHVLVLRLRQLLKREERRWVWKQSRQRRRWWWWWGRKKTVRCEASMLCHKPNMWNNYTRQNDQLPRAIHKRGENAPNPPQWTFRTASLYSSIWETQHPKKRLRLLIPVIGALPSLSQIISNVRLPYNLSMRSGSYRVSKGNLW